MHSVFDLYFKNNEMMYLCLKLYQVFIQVKHLMLKTLTETE